MALTRLCRAANSTSLNSIGALRMAKLEGKEGGRITITIKIKSKSKSKSKREIISFWLHAEKTPWHGGVAQGRVMQAETSEIGKQSFG